MNERIKQLMEQAEDPEHGFVIPELFAQLIVKECIEQVVTGPNGPAHYAVEAALRLKKHFGVEE